MNALSTVCYNSTHQLVFTVITYIIGDTMEKKVYKAKEDTIRPSVTSVLEVCVRPS